jgi:gas vesicle protein
MGAIDRLAAFGIGGVIGAALGSAAAALLAPQSGSELQRKVHERIRLARIAGAEAKAEKEEELIRRFRGSVDSPVALEDERARAREEVAAAVEG